MRRHVPFALFALGLASLVVAIARPVRVRAGVRAARDERQDVAGPVPGRRPVGALEGVGPLREPGAVDPDDDTEIDELDDEEAEDADSDDAAVN